MKFSLPPTLALLSLAAFTSAAPASLPAELAAPLTPRATTCTFTSASAAISGKKACSTIILNNVAVPAGTTLDLTGLTTGTKVIFQGRTTFGYKEWVGPLVSVSGTSITVSGASGSVLDGQGDRWWDGQGGNGGKVKPKFFAAHKLTNSVIENIKILNSPVQIFSINGVSGLQVNNVVVDNLLGDTKGGHNTDAFDVGSSDKVTISGAYVVNQDDCLAVNSGTNIVFQNGYCSGGHGISIGSVGGRSDNTVDTVTISNSQITNSDNGVRIKTVYNATGKVNNVKYTGITLSKIHKYGIVIEQDYQNGSPTGTPTAGVPITGLTLTNVKGTVDSGATNIYVLCAKGACSGWNWSGVSVTGGKKSTKCSNVPATAFC